MSDSTPLPAHAPPARVLVVITFLAAVAVWFVLHAYTSTGTTECRELYRAARTAADTAAIDTLVTAGSQAQNEPRTCGFMRRTARWR